jgi:hypothetical protein
MVDSMKSGGKIDWKTGNFYDVSGKVAFTTDQNGKWKKVETPTSTPANSPTPISTPTQVNTPTALPTATAAETATWTPAENKMLGFVTARLDDLRMKPSEYSITPGSDGQLYTTDTKTGRLIAKNIDFSLAMDPTNTTGIDKLPDGTQVFNPKFVDSLQGTLEETKFKPTNGTRNDSSNAVDSYNLKTFNEIYSIVAPLVGGEGSNEVIVYRSVYLGQNPDGSYSWGFIVGKNNRKTGWVDAPRQLVYKMADGKIVHIPIYYPNYLIFQ